MYYELWEWVGKDKERELVFRASLVDHKSQAIDYAEDMLRQDEEKESIVIRDGAQQVVAVVSRSSDGTFRVDT